METHILFYLVCRGTSNPYKDEHNPKMDNIPPVTTPISTYNRDQGLPNRSPAPGPTCTCTTIEFQDNSPKNKPAYGKRDERDNMPNTKGVQRSCDHKGETERVKKVATEIPRTRLPPSNERTYARQKEQAQP